MTTPTVLIDTDTLIDLDPWQAEAREKRWLHFFLHIAEAAPRNPALLDVIELAKADGARVEYSSRWLSAAIYLVREWLTAHGYPAARVWTRYNPAMDPVALAALHAGLVSGGKRPVLIVHNDDGVSAALRQLYIAALTPAQLPGTVEGLRRAFALARPVQRQSVNGNPR